MRPPSGTHVTKVDGSFTILHRPEELELEAPNAAGPLDMRFDISGQFLVNVVTPNGGPSKGRPVALIEDGDRWSITHLLIPNGLTERALEIFLADTFSGFVLPSRPIRR